MTTHADLEEDGLTLNTADTTYMQETQVTVENNIIHCLGYQLEVSTLEYGRSYYKQTDDETAIASLIFYEDVLSYRYEFHDCSETMHSTQTLTYYAFKDD